MNTKILLTSFQTWLPHQNYNSSDALLLKIKKCKHPSNISLFFLRNLPVNIELATKKVIDKMKQLKPDVVVCCGMAEKRNKLTIESNASSKSECLFTSVDLEKISKNLITTEISNDAGKFVCEGLYYEVLNYIQLHNKEIRCIFIHVPLLDNTNLNLILKDFYSILLSFS